MGIFDVFRSKKPTQTESNAVFGQTALGNNVLWLGDAGKNTSAMQLLYVTTSSTTQAGRVLDVTTLTRNSTVMACVGIKARALAQLPIDICYKDESGKYVSAITKADGVGSRDKAKAKQVLTLLTNPNSFQSQYEFWYQFAMWLDLTGEVFTLLWRKNQDDPMQTPIEMYTLDSSLITTQVSSTRYPTYRLSTPSYGFNHENPLNAHQVVHVIEAAWQGSAGFNKGILATELVALDQDIDLYANFVMQNGAKPSGMFVTDQVIPDAKYKEIAARLKEAWSTMTNSRPQDNSKPGQGMLLDSGMKYMPLDMLSLQDADCRSLKEQTMKRIAGLFGVPPAMLGIADSKYNNTQTMMSEFYKATMYPLIVNLEQKLTGQLLKGYPNLRVKFDTKEFLKGDVLDQMNLVVAGVNSGIITPNEAREYLGMPEIDGADELMGKFGKPEVPAGQSPQDTGGGGGSQKRKMNIGTT